MKRTFGDIAPGGWLDMWGRIRTDPYDASQDGQICNCLTCYWVKMGLAKLTLSVGEVPPYK